LLRLRVDRHRCIGAGNCITLTPTAFGWLKGDFGKAEVIDPTSVDDEILRTAVFSCPTQAIVIEETDELVPWQLREAASAPPQRVQKTFMFTDIVKSTNLLEALGDDAWQALLRWHDETLRALFAAHRGQEVTTTGDGFFVGFSSPDAALACAVAIQRKLADHRQTAGFAPAVRIGVHASDATQVGNNFTGIGVHEAARIASLASGGEILSSKATASPRFQASEPRSVAVKGISEPIEIVTIIWR
jgi:class 3 adenylate cyclase